MNNWQELYEQSKAARSKGQLLKAIALSNEALNREAFSVQLYIQLAQLWDELNEFQKSMNMYLQALLLTPYNVLLYHQLAQLCYRFGHFEMAKDFYLKAMFLEPSRAGIYNDMAILFQTQGQIQKALFYFERAIQIQPQDFVSNYIFALRLSPQVTDEDLFEKIKALEQSTIPTFQQDKMKNHSVIKIGYVSADFRQHSAARVFELLFKYHDQKRFEIHCFSAVSIPDVMTDKFRSLVPYWHSIVDLDTAQACQLIRRLDIDILVDLSGHTQDHRLDIFRHKPAPIQVSGLGFGCTTGLNTIDYRFSDSHVSPLDTISFNCEKVLYLSSMIRWLQPNDADNIPLTENPYKQNAYITFGCNNQMFKLNAVVIEVWSELLKRVPSSRLFLKATQFDDEENRQYLLDLFHQNGILSHRLLFSGKTDPLKHICFNQQIDIALDPFPYNGGISVCESLFMGVPVIALAIGSRTSGSLLNNVGLEQFVAYSKQEYIDKAVKLSQNKGYLERLRSDLRQRFLASVICNGPLFAREVENHYDMMIHNNRQAK